MQTLMAVRCWTFAPIMFTFLPLAANARGNDLTYQWKQGQSFSYQFDVKVDGDDETISYTGTTHYTVDTVDDGQARLTYRGGLVESKVRKSSARPSGFGSPFGPRGFVGPPDFPTPFSRPSFAGKTQTTNRITITTRGETLAMEGDSQLPYLLGNVSLIPFEALPTGGQRQWTVDSGVSITEKSESRFPRPFGPLGPNSPFGTDNKNVQAAGEQTRYAIEKDDGELVVIQKNYQLTTPKTKDNPAFGMTGTGTWTFHRNDHVPQASDMQFKLTVTEGNTTTTIPISLKFTRLSAEKLAAMEDERARRVAERAAAAAAAKSMAEAPLSADEKRETLAALESENANRIRETLAKLETKSLAEPDTDIAAAIRQHIDHADKQLADAANRALLKWSPQYRLRKRLEKEYQGPAVLKSTGRMVESSTPLAVGQLVQAQRKNRGTFWFAAKVKKLLPDGQVELAFLTWGKEQGTEVVQRRQIQLAPEELEQPDLPSVTSSPGTGARTWSDVTGKFKIDAVFISLEDGMVKLERVVDGRSVAIPLEKLSDADQAFIKSAQSPENPFVLE